MSVKDIGKYLWDNKDTILGGGLTVTGIVSTAHGHYIAGPIMTVIGIGSLYLDYRDRNPSYPIKKILREQKTDF